MIDPESREYFRRREQAERAAAKNAVTVAARGLHQELAQNYSQLLRLGALTVSPETRR